MDLKIGDKVLVRIIDHTKNTREVIHLNVIQATGYVVLANDNYTVILGKL